MSAGLGEEFGKGSDGGGGGRGGWDMRVLLFARTRTRCTKPHWGHDLCSVRRLFLQIGGAREWCSVGQDVRNAGTASSVAAREVYSLRRGAAGRSPRGSVISATATLGRGTLRRLSATAAGERRGCGRNPAGRARLASPLRRLGRLCAPRSSGLGA